jgi:DNA modification methylase
LWKDWPEKFPQGGLLFHGDNKDVLAYLLANGFRGKVKLIYIDPPFDSGADYVRKVNLRGSTAIKLDAESYALGEQIQYTDIWANDNYLQFMFERFLILKELLAEDGNIFVHCDDARNFSLRAILEEVFSGCFRNEIIWKRSTSTGLAQKRCGTLHDSIYWYSKTDDYVFNMQFHEYEEEYLKRAVKDENGRLYIPIPTGNPGPRPNLYYEYKGYLPHPNGYKWTREKMEEFDRQGRLIFPEDKNGRIQYKQYLDEMEGVKLQDLWLDIPAVNPVAQERIGYPTQKPESLLERIIKMCSNPGDIVLDCFIGSGTTAAVAQKLGRRWIGADINKGAIQTTVKRLQGVIEEQALNPQPLLPNMGEGEPPRPAQYSFAVYRVNDYDLQIQHNEAMNLACEHLGITRSRTDAFFDGTLGKKLVKIVWRSTIPSRRWIWRKSNANWATVRRKNGTWWWLVMEKNWLCRPGWKIGIATASARGCPIKSKSRICAWTPSRAGSSCISPPRRRSNSSGLAKRSILKLKISFRRRSSSG